jgi:hypothetical protein
VDKSVIKHGEEFQLSFLWVMIAEEKRSRHIHLIDEKRRKKNQKNEEARYYISLIFD